MALLTVNGKDYEAKVTFKFDKLADLKYSKENEKGEEQGGFSNIYMGLLDAKHKYLVAFWDCAFAHLKGNRPNVDEIEEALETKLEAEDDITPLFEEAFRALDKSGFFKLTVKKYWKNMELFGEVGKNEEEKLQNKKAVEMTKESRALMLGETIPSSTE
ncbi:tail assembly chaperone [Bacillus sp. JJ722]|uniref:tail assembly chaperone n=1 Tax=Bacillus sp. JJ722 TaxID=3122973 RepID=UPI003000B489